MAKRKLRQYPEIVRQDGSLCTHFVNTASGKRPGIGTYGDLLDWGQRAGVLGAADAQRLERTAAERPGDAAAALGRVLQVRACLERILLALTGRRRPAGADLDAIAAALGAARSAHRFVPADAGGYLLGWGDRGGDDLERVLWPVLTSAAEVLSPEEFYRVGQCAGEDCTLFFVDRSPGSPRKWCRRCGGRVRSRKHYRTKIKPARKSREERWATALAGRVAEEKNKKKPPAPEPDGARPSKDRTV